MSSLRLKDAPKKQVVVSVVQVDASVEQTEEVPFYRSPVIMGFLALFTVLAIVAIVVGMELPPKSKKLPPKVQEPSPNNQELPSSTQEVPSTTQEIPTSIQTLPPNGQSVHVC